MRIALRVIGIGPGDPRQITLQAIEAMADVEVFIALEKGSAKTGLLDARKEILARHANSSHRLIEIADPPRDRAPADYDAEVRRWHAARADLIASALRDELPGGGVAAFLVWGDPALYDSTLRIVERVLARGELSFDYDVIPGITSVQALAARHRIVLNRIGKPVHITTGRQFRAEPVADAVVMLDSENRFTAVPGDDVHIWWGAYLGMPDETLIEGPLRDVEAEIKIVRAQLRARKGWIMDTYLLRNGDPA